MELSPLPDKGEVDELINEFLAESQEGLERMDLCLTELERRPEDGELLAEIFRAVHTIKGTTGFLGFGRLERLAHAGEGLLGALRDKTIAVTRERTSGLLQLMDGLRSILSTIEIRGTEGERSTDDDWQLIDLLAELKSDEPMSAESKDPALRGPGKRDPNAGHPVLPPDASGADLATGSSMQDKTLRIDVDVLNRMMNQVGELVLTRNQILRCAPGAENFPALARRLDSVTAELRESVMRARMQPVGHLFRKFPRMVRDLAITCGRQVRIEFEGQETGLDKSLLEAVGDPLTHAVRNAVDHGIEPPGVRIQMGKPVEGVLRLRAFHQGGTVVIEVIDDGAGISTERVLEKAIERGLATPEQAASMTQREALQMVFLAGFTTAQTVTNVSGRGMGMDVVRANVEKVGGSVELESRVGAGTTLRMRVPLTLAIVPALVVQSGGESFALPQNALVELAYVPRHEVEQALGRIGTTDLFRLRDGLLPLVWLDRLLRLEPRDNAHLNDFYIAVVESEGRRFGLVVDDLKEPQEIVVKPLSDELRSLGVFSGATVLGDGTLALILDVAATGARAGVRPTSDTENIVVAQLPQPASAQAALQSSMVVYEVAKRGPAQNAAAERMAIPMSAVERIESVPLGKIEHVGGRPVLQYRGELIPLQDEGGVLSEGSAAEVADAADNLAPDARVATVLICLRPDARGTRRIGVVVRRVLDVAAGTLLAEDAATCEEQLALVKDRVTTVHRGFTHPDDALPKSLMQEVA